MTWFDWFLVALWAFAAVVGIANVGKPKKPTTPGMAAFLTVWSAALVVGLLWTRGAL